MSAIQRRVRAGRIWRCMARGALAARRARPRGRRGFAAGLLMVGFIVAIGAMVGLVVQFSDILSESIIYLTTDIPTFEYGVEGGKEVGNAAFAKYEQLRLVWGPLMAMALGAAAVSSVFEKSSLISAGAGYRIFSKSIVMLFFFTFFPYIWDAAAGGVEEMSLWILAPAGPQYITQNSEYILSKVAGVSYTCIDQIKPDHFAGLNDPWNTIVGTLTGQNAGQADLPAAQSNCPVEHSNHPDKRPIIDTLTDVFLSMFRGMFVLTVTVMMFVIGTGRIVLTGVFMIIIPVTEMLGLIPFFTGLAMKIRGMLIALLLLPIFSALAITGGAAYLADFTCESPHSAPDCTPPNPIHAWFVSITVLALVAFMPTIIIPQLGTFSRSMTYMGSNAASYGANAVLGAGQAAVGGGARAYGAISRRLGFAPRSDATLLPEGGEPFGFASGETSDAGDQEERA